MKIFRSNCPLASSLDIIGDKWTLLIIRDMLLLKKTTFKDFENSAEKIAASILASRLKWLLEQEIITKHKLPENKKTNIYLLTDKGISFTPMLLELLVWSEINLREIHPNMADYGVNSFRENKTERTQAIIESYKAFSNSFKI
jgi:DNA-binding HxlR family transcriptional regulator